MFLPKQAVLPRPNGMSGAAELLGDRVVAIVRAQLAEKTASKPTPHQRPEACALGGD